MSPPDLQADLACVIARLEQINAETAGEFHWLWERVMTCDVPRLRAHLDTDSLAILDEVST